MLLDCKSHSLKTRSFLLFIGHFLENHSDLVFLFSMKWPVSQSSSLVLRLLVRFLVRLLKTSSTFLYLLTSPQIVIAHPLLPLWLPGCFRLGVADFWGVLFGFRGLSRASHVIIGQVVAVRTHAFAVVELVLVLAGPGSLLGFFLTSHSDGVLDKTITTSQLVVDPVTFIGTATHTRQERRRLLSLILKLLFECGGLFGEVAVRLILETLASLAVLFSYNLRPQAVF